MDASAGSCETIFLCLCLKSDETACRKEFKFLGACLTVKSKFGKAIAQRVNILDITADHAN